MHADFDRKGNALGRGQAVGSSQKTAEKKTERVNDHHAQQDLPGHAGQMVARPLNHEAADDDDGQDSHGRTDQVVDTSSGRDGDAQAQSEQEGCGHRPGEGPKLDLELVRRYAHFRAGQHADERRRQHHGDDRCKGGQRDGKGGVAFGQVGQNVAGHGPRGAADDDESERDFVVEPCEARDQKRERRHDRELRSQSEQNRHGLSGQKDEALGIDDGADGEHGQRERPLEERLAGKVVRINAGHGIGTGEKPAQGIGDRPSGPGERLRPLVGGQRTKQGPER